MQVLHGAPVGSILNTTARADMMQISRLANVPVRWRCAGCNRGVQVKTEEMRMAGNNAWRIETFLDGIAVFLHPKS